MADETVYPYVLPPTQPYHLNALRVYGSAERIEFLYKTKRSTENLFLGNIDVSKLSLRTSEDVAPRVIKYFSENYYLDDKTTQDITKRVFPKLCWLTDEFLKSGFKYPISVHYNPRIQENVIHPGSIRGIVYNLFKKSNTAYCMYFNTGGVKFDFLNSLRVLDKQELLDQTSNMEIELVADHGSIIPHINLNSKVVKPSVSKWHDFIYRRLTSPSFSIYSNLDIEILKPWMCSERDACIKIYVDTTKINESIDDIMVKSAILAVIGKPYKSDWLTVTHINTFDTPTC